MAGSAPRRRPAHRESGSRLKQCANRAHVFTEAGNRYRLAQPPVPGAELVIVTNQKLMSITKTRSDHPSTKDSGFGSWSNIMGVLVITVPA